MPRRHGVQGARRRRHRFHQALRSPTFEQNKLVTRYLLAVKGNLHELQIVHQRIVGSTQGVELGHRKLVKLGTKGLYLLLYTHFLALKRRQ